MYLLCIKQNNVFYLKLKHNMRLELAALYQCCQNLFVNKPTEPTLLFMEKS